MRNSPVVYAGDHDVVVTFKDKSLVIDKQPTKGPRPHAVSCVGCRREGLCHSCGRKVNGPGESFPSRCWLGACPSCCKNHHVKDHP